MIKKRCKQCYKEFTPTKDEIVFCSSKCRERLTFKRLEWVKKNKDYVLKQYRKYYLENKEIINKKNKIYRKKNKDKIKESKRIYRIKNKKIINKKNYEWKKNKLKNDIEFKILENLRHRVYMGIIKEYKSKKTKELLGCSIEDFKKYLESQFTDGMDWSNYGLFGWHIDHIKPCCSFDLSKPEEQKKCFHYTNLQPLWAKDNLKKGGKIE